MNSKINKRVLEEAQYMLKTKDTIRAISKKFSVSKSTVHKDLQERLPEINSKLYREVADILQYHMNIRHIRGGESTKRKYEKCDTKQV